MVLQENTTKTTLENRKKTNLKILETFQSGCGDNRLQKSREEESNRVEFCFYFLENYNPQLGMPKANSWRN